MVTIDPQLALWPCYSMQKVVLGGLTFEFDQASIFNFDKMIIHHKKVSSGPDQTSNDLQLGLICQTFISLCDLKRNRAHHVGSKWRSRLQGQSANMNIADNFSESIFLFETLTIFGKL